MHDVANYKPEVNAFVKCELMDGIQTATDNQPMVDNKGTFAERFETLRAGMSFQELSDAIYAKTKIRISAQAIYKWTKGGGIDLANLQLVADFYGVNKVWLLFGIGDRENSASLEDAVADLGLVNGQAVLDIFRYKIERAERDNLMAAEKVSHYVSLIERIQSELEEHNKNDEGKS